MIKKYSGQSLAIVFVLLIVGSVIGFALYTRLSRESNRIVEEKSAAEASELVDTIIGLVSTSDYSSVKSSEALEEIGCSLESFPKDGCTSANLPLDFLQNYFDRLGFGEVDFSKFQASGDDFCVTELSMRHSLVDDEVTIKKDEVYSIFVDKVNWDSCNLELSMSDNGGSEGFVLSTFYKEGGKYSPYEFEDIVGYGYEDLGDNWTLYDSSLKFNKSDESFVKLPKLSSLYEIRFKSLGFDEGSSSNLRWEASDCEIEDYLVMKVGATCGGKNVVRSFVIPGQLFAPPLFDYVLFNGQGELKPEPISVED